MSRAMDWLKQASNDFTWAEDSLKTGHFSGACFIAQQIAQKSLKAMAYFRGADLIKGHSVFEISKELNINGVLRAAAARLDQYYITPRYPDAVPSGAPYELFSIEQAKEAIDMAKLFIDAASHEIKI